MKYKVLLISLLSTLAIPYGITSEGDRCGREAGKGNPQREATEEEIAKHEAALYATESDEAKAERIKRCRAEMENKPEIKALTKTIDSQATSLSEAVSNLTTLLTDVPGDNLSAQVIHLVQEREKEKITKRALERELQARRLEQAETNALLDDVLKQPVVHQLSLSPETHPLSDSIPPSGIQPPVASPVLTTEGPTNSLSTYQQELLSRKNQIGEEAWKLLGGGNKSLAAALLNSIQQNPGAIEILSLEDNSFTLRIDGDEQDQIYPF